MDQSYSKESGRNPDYIILSFHNDDIALTDMELDHTLGDYDVDFYDLLFSTLDDRRNPPSYITEKLCKYIPAFGMLTSSKDLLEQLGAMFTTVKTLLEDNGCYSDNKLIYNYCERIAGGILLELRCKVPYTPSNNMDKNILE